MLLFSGHCWIGHRFLHSLAQLVVSVPIFVNLSCLCKQQRNKCRVAMGSEPCFLLAATTLTWGFAAFMSTRSTKKPSLFCSFADTSRPQIHKQKSLNPDLPWQEQGQHIDSSNRPPLRRNGWQQCLACCLQQQGGAVLLPCQFQRSLPTWSMRIWCVPRR